MAHTDEIFRLFKALSDTDKSNVLKMLTSEVSQETVYVKDVPIIKCPHCDSSLFIKSGKRNDVQKYKCKSCCRVFTSRSGTPYHRLQKIDKFESYKALMLEGYLPLKQIAAKVGVSHQTAFDWRHKILSGTDGNTGSFEGITEMDDIWFLYSQKGRKGLNYSRKRGGSKRAGDNDFQAKLLITTDRDKTTDMSLVRIGRLKKSDIQRKVSGRFTEGSTLVSDKHRSISSFAKSEHLEHVSFKASEHTGGGEYHVQNINGMASKLKGIINHSFRGVSTKYLQSYANWYLLKSKKLSSENFSNLLVQNKYAVDVHKNREAIYKRFIENFSRRTYRCPVKRSFVSQMNPELIDKLDFI